MNTNAFPRDVRPPECSPFSRVLLSSILLASVVAGFASRVVAQGPPNWVNQNSTWDLVLAAQGSDVAPGTAICQAFSLFPFTGTTGGDPIYGWNHGWRLKSGDLLTNCRAGFVGELARRYAYIGAGSLVRGGGYEYGGRPVGGSAPWTPELIGDVGSDGKVLGYPTLSGIYPPGGTVRNPFVNPVAAYCGQDLEHDWQILGLIYRKGAGLKLNSGLAPYAPAQLDLQQLVGWRIWTHAEMVAGQLRFPWEINWQAKLALNAGSERNWARPLDVLLEFGKLGLTNGISLAGAGGTDIDGAALAFLDAAIAFHLHQPGIATNNHDRWINATTAVDVPPVPQGTAYCIPTQLAWWVCIAESWRKSLIAVDPTGSEHGSRIFALDQIVQRCAGLVNECVGAAPGGTWPWVVSFPNGSIGPLTPPGVGTSTNVFPTFASVGATFHYDKDNASTDLWAYRALRIAAERGMPAAQAHVVQVFKKYKSSAANWCWLVDPDGLYDVPQAASIAGEPLSPTAPDP